MSLIKRHIEQLDKMHDEYNRAMSVGNAQEALIHLNMWYALLSELERTIHIQEKYEVQ